MHTKKWAASLLFITLCSAASAAEVMTESSATEVVADKSGATKSLPPESAAEEKEIQKKSPGSIVLSAEDAATLKNIVVYNSRGETKVTQIVPHVPGTVSPVAPNPADAFAHAFVGGIVVGLQEEAYRKAIDMPPDGRQKAVSGFDDVNKIMKDGAFLQSINQTILAPFEGKTWFNQVEISRLDKKINDSTLLPILQNRHRQEKLPDAVAVITNRFVFNPGLYKLWFITEVEIHRPKPKWELRTAPIQLNLLHREKFASLYDIRDHFEMPQPEPAPDEEQDSREEFVTGLWVRDNGKLYFDTVTRLAAENAKLIKQFLLDQPPPSPIRKAENAFIMTYHEIKQQSEEPKEPGMILAPEHERAAAEQAIKRLEREKRRERISDGRAMEKMNPAQRKAYMLAKQHEYVRMVDVIEITPERIISRCQNKDVYYSLPAKSIKLIKQNEIDANEFTEILLEFQKWKNDRRQKNKIPKAGKNKAKVPDTDEDEPLESEINTRQEVFDVENEDTNEAPPSSGMDKQ